jgi:hypothetical protein
MPSVLCKGHAGNEQSAVKPAGLPFALPHHTEEVFFTANLSAFSDAEPSEISNFSSKYGRIVKRRLSARNGCLGRAI